MEKKKTGISQTGARMPVVLLKSLLVSYLMAGALLLLLALLLGTFDRESVFLCAGSFDFDSQSRSSGYR